MGAHPGEGGKEGSPRTPPQNICKCESICCVHTFIYRTAYHTCNYIQTVQIIGNCIDVCIVWHKQHTGNTGNTEIRTQTTYINKEHEQYNYEQNLHVCSLDFFLSFFFLHICCLDFTTAHPLVNCVKLLGGED